MDQQQHEAAITPIGGATSLSSAKAFVVPISSSSNTDANNTATTAATTPEPLDVEAISTHFPNTTRRLLEAGIGGGDERSPDPSRLGGGEGGAKSILSSPERNENVNTPVNANVGIASGDHTHTNTHQTHAAAGGSLSPNSGTAGAAGGNNHSPSPSNQRLKSRSRSRTVSEDCGGDDDDADGYGEGGDGDDDDNDEAVDTLVDGQDAETAKRFTHLHKRRAELSRTVQERLDRASARREQLQAERRQHLLQVERQRQAKTQQTRMLRRAATERFVLEAPKALATLRSAGLVCDESTGHMPLSADGLELILMSDPRTCDQEECRINPTTKLRLPVCPTTGQPHRRLLVVAAETFLKLIGDTRVNLIPSRSDVMLMSAAAPKPKKSTAAAANTAGNSNNKTAPSAGGGGGGGGPSANKARRGIAVNPQLFVLAYYNAVLPEGEVDPLLRDCAISMCHITEQIRQLLASFKKERASASAAAESREALEGSVDADGSATPPSPPPITSAEEGVLKPLLIAFSREWQRYARLSNQHILQSISKEDRDHAQQELVWSTEEALRHTYHQLAAAVAKAQSPANSPSRNGGGGGGAVGTAAVSAEVQALSSFIAMLRARLARVGGGQEVLDAFDAAMASEEGNRSLLLASQNRGESADNDNGASASAGTAAGAPAASASSSRIPIGNSAVVGNVGVLTDGNPSDGGYLTSPAVRPARPAAPPPSLLVGSTSTAPMSLGRHVDPAAVSAISTPTTAAGPSRGDGPSLILRQSTATPPSTPSKKKPATPLRQQQQQRSSVPSSPIKPVAPTATTSNAAHAAAAGRRPNPFDAYVGTSGSDTDLGGLLWASNSKTAAAAAPLTVFGPALPPLWTVGADGKSHPPSPAVLKQEHQSRVEYRARAAYTAKLKRDAMTTRAEAEEKRQREQISKAFDDAMWDQFRHELDDASPPILARIPHLLNSVAEALVDALPRRVRSKIGQEIRDVVDWDMLRSRLRGGGGGSGGGGQSAANGASTSSPSAPSSPTGASSSSSSSSLLPPPHQRFEAVTSLVLYVINRVGQLGAPAREEALHAKAKDLVGRLEALIGGGGGGGGVGATASTSSSASSSDTVGTLVVAMFRLMFDSIRQLREDISAFNLQMVSQELVTKATEYEKEFVAECLPPLPAIPTAPASAAVALPVDDVVVEEGDDAAAARAAPVPAITNSGNWQTTKAFLAKGIADAATVPMVPAATAANAAPPAIAGQTPLPQLKPIAESLPQSVLFITPTDKKTFGGLLSGTVDLLRSSGRDTATRWLTYPRESHYFARPLIFEAANAVQLCALRLMISGTISMVLAPHKVNGAQVQQFLAMLDVKLKKWLGGGGGEGEKDGAGGAGEKKGSDLDAADDDDDDDAPINSLADIKNAVTEQVSIFLGNKPIIGVGPAARPSAVPLMLSEGDEKVLHSVMDKMTDTTSPQYTLFETRVLRAVASVALAHVAMGGSGLTTVATTTTAAPPAAAAAVVGSAAIAAAQLSAEVSLRGCGALISPQVRDVGATIGAIVLQNWEVHRDNYAQLLAVIEYEALLQHDPRHQS